MSNIPDGLHYTEDHEYVKPAGEDDTFYVGITDYAQGELGDIVFVELPAVGTKFGKHDVFGTVEAVKAVSELFAPISAEVLEVNARLDREPALVNGSPYDDGWMIRVRATDPREIAALLNADAYKAKLGE